MFDYQVMSKDEAEKARYSLMEKGRYNAVLRKPEAKMSRSNNAMIELIADIYDNNGAVHQVKDYLVFSEKMMWKVIHAMESAGLLSEYEAKKFDPYMLDGKCVKVLVGIQKGQPIPTDKLGDRPEGSCYPDKNCIDDYLVDIEVKASTLNPIPVDDFGDKDLPF